MAKIRPPQNNFLLSSKTFFHIINHFGEKLNVWIKKWTALYSANKNHDFNSLF